MLNIRALTDAILGELRRLDRRWGGPECDDEKSRRDWIAFIVEALGRAEHHADEMAISDYNYCMVQVAALAISAILSTERKALKQIAERSGPG